MNKCSSLVLLAGILALTFGGCRVRRVQPSEGPRNHRLVDV
ncbi:MAG TPA: hypothetical protein VLI39_10300 [Sedimentisphaerales bacterium]|nr:hypothetical protein [Sedimentisphaerales bacterium]